MNARTILIVLLGGQFVANLDTTIVNVAIPSIGETLDARGPWLEAVATAYLIAYACLMIPAARLGPRAGARRVFLGGLALFTLASLAAGLAPSVAALIAARFVQGVGGALMVAQVLTGIRRTFDGAARTRAIGSYTLSLSVAAVVGQLAGGAVVAALPDGLGWRALFLINVPLGIALIALGVRTLPRDAPPVAFALRSLFALDRTLFAIPTVTRRIVALAAARATYFGVLFVVALYVQRGRGESALASGTSLVGWVAAYGFAGLVLPRLPASRGHVYAPLGAAIMASAFAATGLAAASACAPIALLTILLACGGFGFGLLATATTSALTGAVDTARAADLSGVLAAMVPVSAVLGVATFGSAYLALDARTNAAFAFATIAAVFALTDAIVVPLVARYPRAAAAAAAASR